MDVLHDARDHRFELLARHVRLEHRTPSTEEIAAHLSLSAQEFDALRRTFTQAVSIDDATARGVYDELEELFSDDSPSRFPSPYEAAIKEELDRRLQALLGTLTPVERDAALGREQGKKSRQTIAVSRHRAIEKMRAEAQRQGWIAPDVDVPQEMTA